MPKNQGLRKYVQRKKFGKLFGTVLLLILVFILVTVANYYLLAIKNGGMTHRDFMSLWTGGKALTLGLNPYDPAVWRPLRASYGDTWLPDATAPFPAWTFLFFIPFSFLSTQLAGAIWMTLSEIALIAGVALLAKGLEWNNFARYLPWLLIGLALFRPIFSAIAGGQLAPVLFFLLVWSFYLHRRGYPLWSGVVLALQITKPNITMFYLPMAGVIFLLRRDWRMLGGMIAGGAALLAASWVVLPGWVLQWLVAVEKSSVAFRTPTVWGLSFELTQGISQWLTLSIAGVAAVQLLTAIIIWRQRKDDWLCSFAFALAASIFTTPYLWAYDQLPLYFPAMVGLYWGINSQRGKSGVWIAVWLTMMVGLSWGLTFVAASRGVDTLSAFVTLSVAFYLTAGYYFVRQRAAKGGR